MLIPTLIDPDGDGVSDLENARYAATIWFELGYVEAQNGSVQRTNIETYQAYYDDGWNFGAWQDLMMQHGNHTI